MTIAALLQPIAPDAPCGEDLSFSPEFDALVEMRREDDPTLDRGAWVRPLKVADWPGVLDQCESLLRERTKDLRLVAWWTDASARLRGLPGLADGLALCARLCAERWETLHPRPEDGDPDPRAGSLAWLLAQVAVQARLRPPSAADAGEARRARQALDHLERCVDDRLGEDGPSFVAARQALDEAAADAAALGPDPTAGATTPPDGTGVVDAGSFPPVTIPSGRPAPGTASPGGPHDRAEALRQLRSIAGFFRRTEPHSPVAYLADKAADWADLPLHAWLRAVVRDHGTLAHVEELLGVRPEGNAN